MALVADTRQMARGGSEQQALGFGPQTKARLREATRPKSVFEIEVDGESVGLPMRLTDVQRRKRTAEVARSRSRRGRGMTEPLVLRAAVALHKAGYNYNEIGFLLDAAVGTANAWVMWGWTGPGWGPHYEPAKLPAQARAVVAELRASAPPPVRYRVSVQRGKETAARRRVLLDRLDELVPDREAMLAAIDAWGEGEHGDVDEDFLEHQRRFVSRHAG
jgi:hypothetical protein